MNIETRKLNLVQELLKVDNLSLLKDVEAVLAKNIANNRICKSFMDIENKMTLEEAIEFERLINEGCE